MMRFNAAHRKIKEMVKNGKLGKIVMARAQLSCWYPPTEGAWRQKKELSMGGTLTDMGAHCLDILEYILDTNITDVSCFTGNIVNNYEVEDSSLVTARFYNGAFGVIDNYFNIPDLSSKNILEVYGSKGSVLCRGTIGQESSGTCEIYLEEEEAGYSPDQKRKNIIKKEILDIHYENIYEKEIEYFSDCIEKNIEPERLSGSIGLHNMRIIEACYDSANTLKHKKVL
jgi:predicted dehydrogenase